jgi:hypothetical protein
MSVTFQNINNFGTLKNLKKKTPKLLKLLRFKIFRNLEP